MQFKASFYNYLSEQIEICNVNYAKISCTNDAFAIACGLNLHNFSASQHDKIRKNIPFLLLPNKSSLLTGLSVDNVLLDDMFSTDVPCIHSSTFSKLAQCLKEYLVNYENGEKFHLMIVMAFNLDETHIRERHYFQTKPIVLVLPTVITTN